MQMHAQAYAHATHAKQNMKPGKKREWTNHHHYRKCNVKARDINDLYKCPKNHIATPNMYNSINTQTCHFTFWLFQETEIENTKGRLWCGFTTI